MPARMPRFLPRSQSAYQRQQPILAWILPRRNWAPIQVRVANGSNSRLTTMPAYEDPSWGSNPDMAYDCGKPRGWSRPWAGPAGEEKWPAAY